MLCIITDWNSHSADASLTSPLFACLSDSRTNSAVPGPAFVTENDHRPATPLSEGVSSVTAARASVLAGPVASEARRAGGGAGGGAGGRTGGPCGGTGTPGFRWKASAGDDASEWTVSSERPVKFRSTSLNQYTEIKAASMGIGVLGIIHSQQLVGDRSVVNPTQRL